MRSGPAHLGGLRPALRRLLWWSAAVLVVVTAVAVVRLVDTRALGEAWDAAYANPLRVLLVVVVYAAAFACRALAWRRIVPALPFGHALAALHVALVGNHVLPARLGEPLRVTSVVRRAGIPVGVATASTVTLRAADLAAIGLLGVLFGAPIAADVLGAGLAAVGIAGAAAVAVGLVWSRRLTRRGAVLRRPTAPVALLTVVSWLAEAVVVWQAALWAGAPVSVRAAVAVTAVAVAAQVVAVAPGGVGSYEAAATAALVAVGLPAPTALAVAVAAHAVKTAYALAAGSVALVVPAPGLLGRLRLPPAPPPVAADPPPDAHRPVILLLPARDEEATVGDVVGRAPRQVSGHPVEVVVVDDGSTDATATRARAAGATVVARPGGGGLGAAVRTGLATAVRRAPAAVAFCDADGEYSPEELGAVVAPILRGEADYVVGSRFAGRIERMLPQRRAGNRLLTLVLRWIARAPISDGQSGYRALSAAAAADAEIIHDYNYAQVLTLDVLAKGYRYTEVPISYRFRRHGRSFVRLGRYLRAVVPAVYREVNAA